MSEADMRNNPSFPEPTDPARANQSQSSDDRAAWTYQTDSPYNPSEASGEEWQTVNFPNALSIDELENESMEEETASAIELAEPGAIAHSAGALQASGSGANLPQVAELVALIQQLRQRNNDLSHRVAQLENVLHECQSALKVHLERSRERETLLAQRTQALAVAEAKAAHLDRELEASQQQSQQQQNLIRNFTEQLEVSQQRFAQLERECALTQQRYSEQSHQLLQAEATCKDLRSRLHRQQRHTLQFKAALEKCLEMPDVHENFREPKTEDTAVADLPTVPAAETPATAAAADASLLPKTEPIKPWAAPPSSQPAELPATAAELPVKVYIASAAEPVEPVISPPPLNAPELTDLTVSPVNFNPPAEEKIPILTELAVPEPLALPANPLPKEAPSLEKPNWPAPLVYPQQPAKKRQSLAAIDLPSFPRLQ